MTYSGETIYVNNEPSGSVIPLPCQYSKGKWPTCYGYIRGNRPSEDDKLWIRGAMAHICDSNQLHLARIFHDFEVAPNRVDYRALRYTLTQVAHPATHTLFLADLDWMRTPSPLLDILADTIEHAIPHVQVRCLGPTDGQRA